MSYRHELPTSKFELWLIRVVVSIFIFMSGFGAALFYTRHEFMEGADWFQRQKIETIRIERGK